jgi:hypothetical protein
MALDIDPSALSPSGELDPAAYDSPAVHLYGTTTMPLHVAGDMSGITLSLPEATPKELQAFRDAIHQQAQQSPTTAKTRRRWKQRIGPKDHVLERTAPVSRAVLEAGAVGPTRILCQPTSCRLAARPMSRPRAVFLL